jgi:hypothetical protein
MLNQAHESYTSEPVLAQKDKNLGSITFVTATQYCIYQADNGFGRHGYTSFPFACRYH